MCGDRRIAGRPTIDLELAYSRLPIAVQQLATDLAGWRTQRTRYGPRFDDVLRSLEERASWTNDEMCRFRDDRLQAFVRHAVRTVPVYAGRFREAGLAPEDIKTLGDLDGLPVLTKEEVQDLGFELLSAAISRRGLITRRTSGTTGAAVLLQTTPEADREQWAVWWRFLGWQGIQPGTLCAYFGGPATVPLSQSKPPFWRYNRAGRQIRFSRDHLDTGSAQAYFDELRRRRPPWLHGHPSVLARLASYLLDEGTDLGYEVRWITVAAEKLVPHQAALIRDAFGVQPRQHYAMVEAVANASECDHGRLHIDEDFAAFELLDDEADESPRVVGSNLSNAAMPLLRYEVGDLAVLDDAPCGCGRPGRLLAAIEGRTSEYVVLKDGRRVTALSYVFKEMVHIREAQIHQREPGDVTIRVVRGPGYGDADEARLFASARKRLGDTVVSIEYMTEIPRSSAGKLRLVDSELP